MVTLQEMIRRLNEYWSAQGCTILSGYDMEVGAGTSHPATALKCLGPNPWNVSFVQPSRRPADGRYMRNPMRNQRYYQYQVIMKPSPIDIVDRYMGSLDHLGFDTKQNDVRLVEDDWENPSLGAAGVGWEVWLNGTEISQFTFFQQMGGIECNPVCAELTYGPERLCLMLNKQTSIWKDLMWSDSVSYREAEGELEMQHNVYNFEVASTDMLLKLFEMYEAESKRVIETPVYWDASQERLSAFRNEGQGTRNEEGEERKNGGKEEHGSRSGVKEERLVFPAFDLALKCSHVFNLLDARGVIGVTERATYINRIRARVRACCLRYVDQFQEQPEVVKA